MSAGGWNLIHTWLTDGILAKNWALIQELLELLLLCPVDIERLKSNNCPKLIKGLSKEGSHQGVRILASRLVEQWLKIVKGEAAPNSVPAQIMTVSVQANAVAGQNAIAPSSQQLYSLTSGTQQTADATENATVHMQDLKLAQQPTASALTQSQKDQEQQQERLQSQTVQLQVVGKAQQVQQTGAQQGKKQSFVVVSTSSQSPVPVYKITIRDGNQVLAKVETDPANISSVRSISGAASIEVNGSVADATALTVKKEGSDEVDEKTRHSDSATSGKDNAFDVGYSDNLEHVSSEVKQTSISSKDSQDVEGVKNKDNKDSKDIISSDSGKSSDKENRDLHKKDDKKSSSSSDKKSSSHHHSSSSSKSSSKHSTSSSTHRSTSHKSSSHRSSSSSSTKSSSSSKDRSSKDKDKHHSSSSSKHSSSRSKSERDKEREKEKQKKDQAEKDKATLEKVQGQALSSKLGKIPKKRPEDEKSGDMAGRKSSTESRDSSKENKEKADSKVIAMPEKKNISISIESRKNSQDSITRPKTVKTFNSKFRSTGLEEEVKPPPPRSKKPNPVVDKKVIPQKLPVLKRPSPMREAVPLMEKRAKLTLDSPTTPPADEKKGGIKLIPPKPKRKCIGILSKITYNIYLLIRSFYYNSSIILL